MVAMTNLRFEAVFLASESVLFSSDVFAELGI
jgi:hypothetical protein